MGGTPAGARGSQLLGRRKELGELLEGLDDARRCRGRLFVVTGDAGMGKTSLLQALEQETAATGAWFLWGRCSEGVGAPAYWPWAEVLRECLRGDGEPSRSPRHDPTFLAPMFPGLAGDGARGAADRGAAPGDRFRLFGAVARLLTTAADERPHVVALDDLHAADEPSLRLLQFLAQEVPRTRLLLVGTYRDAEARRSRHLHQLLTSIAGRGRTVALTGLDAAAVSALLAEETGTEVDDAFALQVHELTEGNPFFVRQVARLARSPASTTGNSAPGRIEAMPISVPDEVHEVLRRRLEPLSSSAVAVLTIASVLGREFDLRTLARISGQTEDEAMDLLAEAGVAGVVAEVGLGRWAFSHALLRETLYGTTRPSHRAALHHRVASALEALHAHDLSPHLPALAHHFFEAARRGDGTKAVEYCARAAGAAMASAAFEEAADLYQRALEAIALCSRPDERRRCELMIGLVEARHRSGDFPRAREFYRRAVEAARRLNCPQLFARAALSLPWRGWSSVDDAALRVLEEARNALGDDEDALRARVLLDIAGALTNLPVTSLDELRTSRSRTRRLAEEGLHMARRCGDRATLRAALFEWHLVMRQFRDTLPQRKAALDELMAMALEDGDRESLLMARSFCRVRDLFEAGEGAAMRHELDVAAREAAELRIPLYLWMTTAERAALALLEGRFDDAESLTRSAAQVGEGVDSKMVRIILHTQLISLRRMQGRFAEWHDLSTRRSWFHLPFPTIDCSRVDRALATLELGRRHEARAQLEEMLPEGLGQIEAVPLLCCASGLAELCWRLDDAERGAPLYDCLLPYEHAHAEYGLASLGSCARSLGQLATLLGRFDEAEGHFAVAHRFHRRMGARAWVAHTQLDHARMLLQRGRRTDVEHAVELIESARDVYRALGSPVYEERAARLLAEHGDAGPPAHAGAAAVPPSQSAVFRREGEYWCIAFGAAPVHLRHTKGLGYLHRLLRAPRQEIHALELAAGSAGDARREQVFASDAGPTLDARAKAAYRQRLAELDIEVSGAATERDGGRRRRMEDEKAFLIAELAGAVGLGGRDRKAASSAERARQSVTRAVKYAIERIDAEAPGAGAHLKTTVRTGLYCSYTPDPRAPVRWEG